MLLPAPARTRRDTRPRRLPVWSEEGVAERTSVDPLLRRRNRMMKNAVMPSHAKATPRTRKTAGTVSMLKFRSETRSRTYYFSHTFFAPHACARPALGSAQTGRDDAVRGRRQESRAAVLHHRFEGRQTAFDHVIVGGQGNSEKARRLEEDPRKDKDIPTGQ